MSKSRLAPPPPAPDIVPDTSPAAIERFIQAAPGKQPPRTWLLPGVRPDVRTAFSMRIPEPLALKLEWLAEVGSTARNVLIVEALEAYATAELARLGEGT